MELRFLHLAFFGFIWALSDGNHFECGMTAFAKRLIFRCTDTERGEFPFLTALYIIKEMKFICGGSLISSQHVLTAAHCVKGRRFTLRLEDIVVLLGAFDLTSRVERGVVQRDIIEIHIHPDWYEYNDKYDADIAILVLSEMVTFTNYIRPVCMPPDNSVVANSNGTIVGWGLTENGTEPHLKYPKQGVTVALNDSYCYTTDYVAAIISSVRTFCGSGGNSSPNSGDSGGGYFVRYGLVWVQYGIVSAIRLDASGNVNPNSVSIYTNVNEFKTWISHTVELSGGRVAAANEMATKIFERNAENLSENSDEIVKVPIQLQCVYDFFIDFDGITNYGCFLVNLDISNENTIVTSISGSHMIEKTDRDVMHVSFRNGTALYLPDGIANIFQNLKRVEIDPGLQTKLIRRSNFKNLNSVVSLHFFHTDIEIVVEDCFWNLPELNLLYFSDNKLRQLEENTFVTNHKLRVVYFERNELEFIPVNLFRNNLLLERVWFFQNNLKAIHEQTFVNNRELRVVNFERNKINSIPRNLFKNNLLLENVDFSHSLLKVFDVDFTHFHSIKTIFLNGNLCINKFYTERQNKSLTEFQYEVRLKCSSTRP